LPKILFDLLASLRNVRCNIITLSFATQPLSFSQIKLSLN